MNVTELKNEIRIRNNTIARLIENGVDEDGVISDETLLALEKADKKTLVIIEGTYEGMQGYKTLADAVKSKIERLKSLEKYYRNTENSLKGLMLKLVPEGENYNTENYSISWRKSKSVVIDAFASLKEIESEYPETIKTVKTFNKIELKKLLNNGVKIDGVKIAEKYNMQLK